MHARHTRLCARTLALTLLPTTPALAQSAPPATSFEHTQPGPLHHLDTPAGRFTAEPGHAVVDAAHHRTGSRCLHIQGGDRRTVTLTPPADLDDVTELRFWSERWTRRPPFTFRVEHHHDGAWRELWRGDDEVEIGHFRTHVRIPLDRTPDALRFVCTSPSGVLIDDLRFGRDVPMRVTSVAVTQPVAPCLVHNDTNVLTHMEIETDGQKTQRTLREVHIDLDGTTDLADVAAVELRTQAGTRFAEPQAPAQQLVFRGDLALEEGTTTLLVSIRLRDDADIDHVVDAGCTALVFDQDQQITPPVTHPPGAQRMGIALRRAGDDGVAAYRIPGITTTNAGTVVAVYDVRHHGMKDLPGDIDVGVSRSLDGGRTWQPMQIVLDMGQDPAFRHDGVGDPSILTDTRRGTLWVAATWSHGDRSWHGSGPGLTADETGQLMLVRSDDDGVTWSKPINITAQVKDPAWAFLLAGPGRGICMRDGTLVFPAQYRDTPEKDRVPRSTILFSTDGGATWQLGTAPRPHTTEAQVVELQDGVLMLNMRDDRGGARAIYTTSDLGRTWTEHPTSKRALPEPVCNAALLALDAPWLLFVNPAVAAPPRRHMTAKLSPDFGMSWPLDRQLLLDEGTSAGYASATRIDRDHVGVLFECSSAMLAFVRLRIDDIRR